MRKHYEKRTLPYTAKQLYQLVSDVEHYPSFLPWCLESHVVRSSDRELTAILSIGWKGLRDTFTSHVSLDPDHTIVVKYGGGPLKRLENEWHFVDLEGGRCEVSFYVSYDFKSILLGKLMDVFFDSAFCKMVEAFEKRASFLYNN